MNLVAVVQKTWLILLAVFIIMMGYGVLMPVLPFYTERLSAGNLSAGEVNFHIGLLTSSYPLAQLFFVGYWGKLSDLVGRKPLILVGICGFIIMQLLSGLATNLWMFYTARIIGGILSSTLIPVGNAYISDIVPEKDRSKAFGLMGSAVSTGVISGPFFGGFFARNNLHLQFSWLGHFKLDQYSVPFLIMSLVGILVLLVVAYYIPGTRNKTAAHIQNPPDVKRFPTTLKWLFALSLIIQLSVTLFESSFSIYGKKSLAFSPLQLSYAFMICGAVMAIGQPLVTLIKPEVFSYRKQIISGLVLSGIMLSVLPFINSIFLIWIVIGLFALGNAFITPNLSASIANQNKTHTGQNLGLQSTFNSIGQFIGPLAGVGLLAVGDYLPFVFMGIILLVVGIAIGKFLY